MPFSRRSRGTGNSFGSDLHLRRVTLTFYKTH